MNKLLKVIFYVEVGLRLLQKGVAVMVLFCKAGCVQLLVLHITSASGVWHDCIDLPFGAGAGSFGAVASPGMVEGSGARLH